MSPPVQLWLEGWRAGGVGNGQTYYHFIKHHKPVILPSPTDSTGARLELYWGLTDKPGMWQSSRVARSGSIKPRLTRDRSPATRHLDRHVLYGNKEFYFAKIWHQRMERRQIKCQIFNKINCRCNPNLLKATLCKYASNHHLFVTTKTPAGLLRPPTLRRTPQQDL